LAVKDCNYSKKYIQ